MTLNKKSPSCFKNGIKLIRNRKKNKLKEKIKGQIQSENMNKQIRL